MIEIFSPSPKPPFTLPKQETRSWKPTYSPQPSWKSYSSSRETKEKSPSLLDTSLKKLETKLEETKKELKLLKDRESEIEVDLASLNAELYKNMSKIAKAEETKAAKKVAALKSSMNMANVVSSGVGWKKTTVKKVTKKKPITPLLGDLFSKKKRKSNASISRSTLKRICRGLGISRWPYKNDKNNSVLKPNHTDVVIYASDRTATLVLGTLIEPSGTTNIYVPVSLTEHGNQSSTLVRHNEEQTNLPDGSAQPKTTNANTPCDKSATVIVE
nr:WEB family protein At1g75720-like [Tanacetum cinerariifolium]